MKTELTAERLRELLSYDPETGDFVWREARVRPRTKAGSLAGYAGDRYRSIGICGGRYQAHRLAWLWVHGRWPSEFIDHIDGDGFNNRLANLREATLILNRQNQHRAASHNKSGFLGIYWHARDKRWVASIRIPGRTAPLPLGRFLEPEPAHAAYIAAKREYHEGCTI